MRWPDRTRDVGWVLLPLRLFLGVTFVYAGLLKLTDPTYLDPSSPTSVHAQMLRAAQTSPIGWLVSASVHVSTLTGLAIAFGELAVGAGVLLGLWTRLAAVGGLLLSLTFFLTVSWNTRPYFFGSDIVFVFAWTTVVIAGDGGVLTVLTPIRRRVRRQLGVRADRRPHPEVAAEVERRTTLQSGVLAALVGAVALLFGSLSALAASRRSSTASRATRPTVSPPVSSPSPTASASGSRPAGTAIGEASQVPVGGAAQFMDPHTGQPAYVVQPTRGEFRAFSAICTHAGCTVEFQSGQFLCPCHASTFDGVTGAVLSGPAPASLPAIPVTESGGVLYET